MNNIFSKVFKWIALIVCIIILIIFMSQIINFKSKDKIFLDKALKKGKKIALETAESVNKELKAFIPVTDKLADDLNTGNLPLVKESIEIRLKSVLESNKLYSGVGVAFTPYSFDKNKKLYAPYYYRKDNFKKLLRIETKYDYTEDFHLFYHVPMKQGSGWLEPHYTKSTKKYVAEYASVFEKKDEKGNLKRNGVVFLNYSFDGIKNMMAGLDFGSSGYGFIFDGKGDTKDGLFVAHPNDDFVKSQYSIFDLAKETKSKTLEEMGKKALKGESGVIEYNDVVTGESSWIFFEKIPTTNWTICVVLVKEEIFLEANRTGNRDVIRMITTLILSIIFLMIFYILHKNKGDAKTLWISSFVISLIFVLGIIFVWYIIIHGEHREKGETLPIISKTSLEQFKDAYRKKSEEMRIEPPVFIPAGIMVQSLQFVDANTVMVTGYVWNKFPNTFSEEEMSKKLVLPESDSIGFIDELSTEVYRKRFNNYTTVGWYFQTTLRQNFNYSTYPLDQENVWFRMWPGDFDRNYILVPDLESYNVLTPNAKPGIEKDFVLKDWNLESSFFSFQYNSYNTNFGIKTFANMDDKPELYFNMLLKRYFLSPFISDLLPLIIVSIMLFSLMLIITKNELVRQNIGFSSTEVINACAALFFVVILAQIQIREKLQTPDVIYLEYFYFVSYFMLLGVGLNSLIFSWTDKYDFIEYKDNLIPKTLFWPLSLGIMFYITISLFY